MSPRCIIAWQRRKRKHLATKASANTLAGRLAEVKAEKVGESLTYVKGASLV